MVSQTQRWAELTQRERGLPFVTNLLGCTHKLRPHPMTDYSTAIFGLIAFTAVVSAAVVYVLAQPSDLPVVKKAKSAQN